MNTPDAAGAYTELFADLSHERKRSPMLTPIDQWIMSQVHRVRQSDLAHAAFSQVSSGAVRRSFQMAFETAQEVFERIGAPVPQAEDFTLAGTSWQRIAQILQAPTDDSAQLKTECAPAHKQFGSLRLVIAPHGIGFDEWRDLFSPEIRLSVARDVLEEFEQVDHYVSSPQGEASMDPPTVVTQGRYGQPVIWGARLIDCSLSPSELGKNWFSAKHPTLPELLSIQLGLLRSGEPLIDPHTFTWLDARVSHAQRAVRHSFDSREKTIRISSRDLGQQAPHQGSRTVCPS
jgi:hypothetical protein